MLKGKITKWLKSITDEGDLPDNCEAVYIGLFESEKEYMIYFLGSTDFDPENDDWACEEDNDYYPKNKYLESGVSTSEDWEKFQDDVVEIIKNIKTDKNLILAGAKNIAVGFDNGDLEYL